MSGTIERVLDVGAALDRARLPWAFGGVVALAFAVDEPRGSREIVVHVFAPPAQAAQVCSRLPRAIQFAEDDIAVGRAVGVMRLWWDDAPIVVHLDGDASAAARRVRRVQFAGRTIRILAEHDLAQHLAADGGPQALADLAALATAPPPPVTHPLIHPPTLDANRQTARRFAASVDGVEPDDAIDMGR